ncbi:hypothetical protein AWB76_02042 [Caballeronia temeraria]|uniref:Uncharacterized protein n=1 Tax=Caballeronia temeraria TaxID=1777137 RepID=A0A158AC51_9BURK|nr:hypothetical protein [Caballeronia temeraria]SAK54667.1 hypothetical protein AWB76_02042 [Caballeronia temeraria]
MIDKDEPQRAISLRASEINALKKAIMYLKFACSDIEANIFASSPFINSALKELLDAESLGKLEVEIYEKGNEGNERYVLLKINQIEASDSKNWSDDLKKNTYEAWMYPFRLTGRHPV